MNLIKIINKTTSFYPIKIIDDTYFFVCSDVFESGKTLFEKYNLNTLEITKVKIQDDFFIGKKGDLLCFQTDFGFGNNGEVFNNTYDSTSGKLVQAYKTHKELYPDKITQDYLLANYQDSDTDLMFLEALNPFTQDVLWKIKAVSVDVIWNNYFLSVQENNKVNCHSSHTGELQWTFDTNPYFWKDIPLDASGDPLYTSALETVKYNPVHDLLVVKLYPQRLLALEAATGKLVWVTEIPISTQWEIDTETGNIYMMETARYMETYYLDGVAHQAGYDTCIYHHIEGSTGNTLLRRDLKEVIAPKHKNGTARALGFHHFAGYKEDSLYLSLFGEGELYKLNKHTGEPEESYIHDRNFESEPIIHQNRLFLTDPGGEEETRLLVFEI